MATRRKKLGGVSLNLDPKSQLTSVSSISDQDADTLMALRGLDGKLSIADVVSKTNLTEDKIVSLAKKGILMAQFTDFDLEAEIQETQPVDQLGETVVKLSGEMENMMGRMQIMEQKQGSLQDQITSMREVNSASAAVMDGIERRQKQLLDFLQQQTAESSQALQGVREQLLEQSKLIQQQATDRQETDRKEPMASQSRREEVLTQGASQFDTVLMRGHSGNVSSTPTVQSRPSFVFPPLRPPAPAHFPPHYLRRPEVFFTGPGFTSELPVDSEEEEDSVDEESHSGTRDMMPEKMKLQREHKGQLVHDPSQEEGMQKAHTSRGPRMSHQEIRQRKMLKDGSGWGMDNLPKHTDRTSEAKASKGQGDKKSRRSRHRSSSPEKDRRAHKRSSTSEPSERRRRHRHRHRSSSSESSDESGDRHDKGRKYKHKSHRRRKSSSSSDSSPHSSRRNKLKKSSRHHKNNVSHVSSSESSDSESNESGDKHTRSRRMPPFPKLPAFDGKAAEWRGFIFQFRKLAKSGRWTEREKRDRLLGCLRGKAITYVQSRPKSERKDYYALKELLNRRYRIMELPATARRYLQSMRQEEAESLDDFADRVLVKVAEGYPEVPDNTLQILATENFLRGCKDRSAAYAAAERKPDDLQTAMQEVRDAAANLKIFGRSGGMSARQVTFKEAEENKSEGLTSEQKALVGFLKELFHSEGKPVERRSTASSPNRSRSPSPGRCYKCQEPGHRARECNKTPICFKCGKPGHISPDCLSEVKQSPPSSPRPGTSGENAGKGNQ